MLNWCLACNHFHSGVCVCVGCVCSLLAQIGLCCVYWAGCCPTFTLLFIPWVTNSSKVNGCVMPQWATPSHQWPRYWKKALFSLKLLLSRNSANECLMIVLFLVFRHSILCMTHRLQHLNWDVMKCKVLDVEQSHLPFVKQLTGFVHQSVILILPTYLQHASYSSRTVNRNQTLQS